MVGQDDFLYWRIQIQDTPVVVLDVLDEGDLELQAGRAFDLDRATELKDQGLLVLMLFVVALMLIVACYVECRLARIVRKGVAEASARPVLGPPQHMVKGKGAAKTAPATGQEGSKGSAAAAHANPQ